LRFTRLGVKVADAGVMDYDSPRRQLGQQLRHCGCNLTITGDGDCPFKVFPELSRADAPSLEGGRRHLPNLYQGPVPGKSQCRISIRKRTAHDEVIVPNYKNPDHAV
jgi:hypothetical protein